MKVAKGEGSVVTKHNPTSVDKRALIDRVFLHAAVRGAWPAMESGTRSVGYGELGTLLSGRITALRELIRPGELVALERRQIGRASCRERV